MLSSYQLHVGRFGFGGHSKIWEVEEILQNTNTSSFCFLGILVRRLNFRGHGWASLEVAVRPIEACLGVGLTRACPIRGSARYVFWSGGAASVKS